jgi:hypothetical protein
MGDLRLILLAFIGIPSYIYPSYGPIAQWLEQPAHNRLVPGSNPGRPTL